MPKAQKKGFARLSKEERIEVSRKGGFAVQKSGKANRFTTKTSKKALKAREAKKAEKATKKRK
jgi:hypothetical protein